MKQFSTRIIEPDQFLLLRMSGSIFNLNLEKSQQA